MATAQNESSHRVTTTASQLSGEDRIQVSSRRNVRETNDLQGQVQFSIGLAAGQSWPPLVKDSHLWSG